jgi:hypothetical protein
MVRKFSFCKEEYEKGKCEDALDFQLEEKTPLNSNFLKIAAIADGASTSAMAGEWANKLVKAFIAQPFWDEKGLLGTLEDIGKELIPPVGPMPWYAEEKFQMGAFSTFLRAEFTKNSEDANKGEWKAIAVGDSCIFQCNGKGLIQSFPISEPEKFNNRPDLIASNPLYNQGFSKKLKSVEGDWVQGDIFILATDALAKWFLVECKKGLNPWEVLDSFQTEPAFDTWVQQKRTTLELDDDDTSYLIWRIEQRNEVTGPGEI